MKPPHQPSPDRDSSPAAFYTKRRADCLHEIRRRRRQHLLLGYIRLAWAVGLLLVAWFAFVRHACAWEWLTVPWCGFAISAYLHAKLLAAGARAERGAAWCDLGVARIEDRWAGLRPRTTRIDSSQSLYAADLDLFGPASLFELLSSARTTVGEDTLASWLLQPASAHEILGRQAAVQDLRGRTALRESIVSTPGRDPLALDRDALVAWGEADRLPVPSALRWVAPLLVALTLAACVAAFLLHSFLPLVPFLVINGALTFLLQRRHRPLFSAAEQASRRFSSLSSLFAHLEAERFEAPALIAAQAKLLAGPRPSSKALRRLATLSMAVEQRSNWLIRIVDVPLLYSVQLSLLLQSWLSAHGRDLRAWFEALGELEALLSLSAYHFEHPEDTFPELAAGGLHFAAEGLGHPLLPRATCVRNDITLDADTRLLLVSGSNMSGKSTLLRSAGIAAVLAAAGAPVRARRLRLSPLQIGASIQINDSLQSGRSRFYAEILRLRAICDLARAHPPILFLLDELLAGTNSRDRLAGATGLVRALLAYGAIGLLSTHDLALTSLTGPDAHTIRNVHFEDSISGDRLHFDYTLRDGVVTRSNGLELMRLIGLDV